jgi:hypothetical protein
MLSLFDDYCVHQSANTIRQPATDDPNAYDRYFANGFETNGGYYFALGLGRYPNRGVMDAAITFLIDGTHHSFFVSARDPDEPTQMTLGPLALSIDSPMRRMTVSLEPNDSGLSCRLTWSARSAPLQEDRNIDVSGEYTREDATRWTQFGCWEGWFEIDGVRTEVRPERCPGVKDRSWGVRRWGLGKSEPSKAPKQCFFWNWIPLNFGDFCVHSLRFEDGDGNTQRQQSLVAPMYADDTLVPIHERGVRRIARWEHEYEVSRERRSLIGGRIRLSGEHGGEIALSGPKLTAWTYAIGYGHPKWRHGAWHGELATGHERWNVAQVDYHATRFGLMHQIVEATFNGRKGIGFIEQMIVGPYQPYGLADQHDSI